MLERLTAQACSQAAQGATATWRRLRLRALDATTVSVPREEELFHRFGAHG